MVAFEERFPVVAGKGCLLPSSTAQRNENCWLNPAAFFSLCDGWHGFVYCPACAVVVSRPFTQQRRQPLFKKKALAEASFTC